jgi:leucyl-tRNA synthetase
MFLGPFNQGGDFYDSGIEGMYRFLRRIWVLLNNRTIIGDETQEITRARHKTIYGVTKDIEDFGYNTALSKIMELYNIINKNKGEFESITIAKETVETILKLLSPFAPHMTEELWERLGLKDKNSHSSIHLSTWPTHDEAYLVEDSVSIAIQVNGKRRGELTIASNESGNKESIQSQAEELVKKYLLGEVKKVIYVPGKIINFVVTS